MDNFNAFINEILTIDFSYFWRNWEVVKQDEDAITLTTSARAVPDLGTANFIPYCSSEIGSAYAEKFSDREFLEYPTTFPVSLLQSAITDLLMFNKEQQQQQVNRLRKIYHFWKNDFELSPSRDGLLYESLCLEVEGAVNQPSREVLSVFNYISVWSGVISENLPTESENVYLTKDFYYAYERYINEKLSAIHVLIQTSGFKLMDEAVSKVNHLTKKDGRHNNQNSEEKKSTLIIRTHAQDNLVNKLSKHVDEGHLKDLKDLINGQSNTALITVKCKQNVLGKIFFMAYENKDILGFKKSLAKWICQHFQREDNGQLCKLTYNTMVNHLKGNDLSRD